MVWLCLCLVAGAFLVACPATWACRALGNRLGTHDSAGVAGQIKPERRRVPNIGGVAIFWAIALPMAGGLLAIRLGAGEWLSRSVPGLAEHLAGIERRSGEAWVLLGGLAVLHALGLRDDRRPLGPWLKLGVMFAVSAAVVVLTDSRLLSFLGPPPPAPGESGAVPWVPWLLAVLWIVAITNAMNFMDNMDGLSAGVAAIAGGCFLVATLGSPQPQWFIAACLALLVGASLGFLVFNFPRPPTGRATIYMGDGGSLVIGFLLAFLTVRTTYVGAGVPADRWHAVLMPLVVLAIPVYDTASVVLLRLSQGRSPMLGDTQHLSHRLERRGLSRRDAVLVIYGLTGVTAISGVWLSSLEPWQGALVGVQTLLVLGVMALYEGRQRPPVRPGSAAAPGGGPGGGGIDGGGHG